MNWESPLSNHCKWFSNRFWHRSVGFPSCRKAGHKHQILDWVWPSPFLFISRWFHVLVLDNSKRSFFLVNILGKPWISWHKTRFFGFAISDRTQHFEHIFFVLLQMAARYLLVWLPPLGLSKTTRVWRLIIIIGLQKSPQSSHAIGDLGGGPDLWQDGATQWKKETMLRRGCFFPTDMHNIWQLVGGLEHFLFFHILGIIIPTDH